jgi:enediyne biosynthesis protein CalE5
MEASGTLDRSDMRAQLHAMWDGVAPAWGDHADFIDARGLDITTALLARTEPAPGERVLELAAGPGSVGLAAARLVGGDGEVVISDVSPRMAAIAAERAAQRKLPNVRTEVLDLERIAVPDASFDVILCREGLMLVPDPAAAAREILRVLRPGGRFALSVWGPRARNPWLGVIFDTLTAASGTPVPPPGIPGPFSLDDAGRLERILTGAGLGDVTVGELPTPYRAATVPEWWQRSAALAGPMAKRLAALPAFARQRLMEKGGEAIARYATADGLDIPGVSLLASGRRL